MKLTLAFLFCAFFTCLFSQLELKGVVIDSEDSTLLYGVQIRSSEGEQALTDTKGQFTLKVKSFPLDIYLNLASYAKDTLAVKSDAFVRIFLNPVTSTQETVVVTSAKRKQQFEEVPVSMEILKPKLITGKGFNDLEQALDQSPGVYAMDGQISIRGGSGFAYGAGSRVLLLWNGAPMISADAGDAKWNTIPLESIGQIEVIKGASSVLYGSGALNGIISIIEKEPKLQQVFEMKVQNGIYGNPKRESLRWWGKNPSYQQVDLYASKMYNKFGYTASFAGFTNKGYRQGETEQRLRWSGSVYFKSDKIKRLKTGFSYNLQAQKTGNFIIWQSDSLAYIPSGGADTSDAASTLTFNRGIRFSVDPYLKYIGKKNGVHNLKSRYYFIDNKNYTNLAQSSKAEVYFLDYQYQKNLGGGFVLTTGSSYSRNQVRSDLYSNHASDNVSLYGQMEWKYDKWYVTAGTRFEYYKQDQLLADSHWYFGKDSANIPLYPILRLAASYKLFRYSNIRASFGQGVRYPTVAERFTQTSVGSLNIFPNADLKRETGWAAELGWRQGLKVKEWRGFLDVAGFVNQYDNMMEFAFGFYLPDSLTPSVNPNDPGYIPKWFGFKAQNAEKARITGLEASINGEGKIKQVTVTTLLGYTYMNPISLNLDSAYRSTFSDTNGNILKYRFRHLVKADLALEYKGWTLGMSARYTSYMKNIDKVFETSSGGVEILPGLKEYRQEHNKGVPVFDVRLMKEFQKKYSLSLLVNNLFNVEYMTRPGDIQSPRTFVVQFRYVFEEKLKETDSIELIKTN